MNIPGFSAEVGNYCFSRAQPIVPGTNKTLTRYPNTSTTLRIQVVDQNSEVVGIKKIEFSIRLGNTQSGH
jgi:hypothetical protein